MPEFRFRRKKKQQKAARRHTVHDAEEAQAQVAAAREMVNRDEEEAAKMRACSPSVTEPNNIPEPTAMAMTTEGGHMVSTGTLAREREKFFDLLRSKYPEHGEGIEEFLSSDNISHKRDRHSRSQSADLETMLAMHTSGEEEEEEGGERVRRSGRWGERELVRKVGRDVEREGKRERESVSSSDAKEASSEPEMTHHHYRGCFFLRHGTELRRCPIPSPITLSTLKNLLVNTFDLQVSLLDDPMCYVMIQDRGSLQWKPLTDISDVYDHCILQLADPDAPVTNPTHFLPEVTHNDHTHSSSESPPFSTNHTITTPPSSHIHYNHSSLHTASLRSPHTEVEGTLTLEGYTKNSPNDRSFNSLWQSEMAIPVSPPSITPNNSHPTTTAAQFGSPHSVTSSTSGVCSDALQMTVSPQRITRHVRVIQRRVQELRRDYETYRKEQLADISDFSLTLRGTTCKIMAAIRGHSRVAVMEQGVNVESFRRQRLELTADKDAYNKNTNETLLEVSILETAVEDIRRDVVERRCRVHEREVDGLINAIQSAVKALCQMKDQYRPLEAKIRKVMEQELITIVEEERFIEDEGPRLEDAEEKCLKLSAMLETLKQVAAVQFHRTPLVPYFRPVNNPDRGALMENIKAVAPNHTHRVESIEMAKCVQHKKKELVMGREGIRHFESQLRVQKDHLHKMDSVSQLDDRREKRMIALYMEEKAHREAELAKEIKWEQKVAERKRQEERERVKERLIQKEDEKKKKKRRRVEQLRSSMEGDQSSQSVTGDDSCGEWYNEDVEEDSLQFSSSFSSTASLLDHVRSLNEKDKQNKTDDSPVTMREDHQLITTTHAAKQSDRSTGESQNSHVQPEYHLAEEKTTAASTRSEQNHSKHRHELPENKSLQAPPPKSSKPPKKTKQQQDTRLPQPKTASQTHKQKAESQPKNQPKGHQAKGHQAKGHQAKGRHSERVQLNGTQVNTRSAAQSPTTGLNAAFKTNETGLSQETHKKHITQGNHTRTQKNVQPTKHTPEELSRKFHRQKVALNDSTAPPAARRVASSESLLEDSHSTKSNTRPANRQISNATSLNNSTAHPAARRVASSESLLEDSHSTKTKTRSATNATSLKNSTTHPAARRAASSDALLEDAHSFNNHTVSAKHPIANATSLGHAPPRTRKSIGHIDDQAHVYDLLEKKVKPQTKRKEPGSSQRGLQTPVSDLGVQQQSAVVYEPPTSASQPGAFDLSSNPSYEKGAAAKRSGTDGGMKPLPNNNTARQSGLEWNNQNGLVVQNQQSQTSTKVHHQAPHMHHSSPKTAVVRQAYVQSSMKPKPVVVKTTNQSVFTPPWPHSESESSGSERVRSVLSDNSSMQHSTMSTIAAQPSGYSNSSHQAHSQKPSRTPPSVQGSLSPPPLHGDNLRNHSGLPIPRKRYNSHQHDQSSGRGHSKVSPRPPSPRHNNGARIHDKDALTSYPRFQRREEHKARLQITGQQHRTKQLGVLPGTGQLAQFTKPVRDHHSTVVQQSKRRPDVGSLV